MREFSSLERCLDMLITRRFNACRYPVKSVDTAIKHDPHQNNHVVFIRKNKFFAVPLEVDGVQLSAAELESYAPQLSWLPIPI